MISIIIPTLNEESTLSSLLDEIYQHSNDIEVIVADGGSLDKTLYIASHYPLRIVQSKPGRAKQMNAGAAASCGELLWFVHADSQLPKNWNDILQKNTQHKTSVWGRFNVKLSGSSPAFRIIESSMNWRSCFTGICTGDQAIWVLREAFLAVKQYPDQALMEDIELSKRLKALSPPLCHKETIGSSSRYWETHGILRTVLRMWRLRLRYFLGTSPSVLHDEYYGKKQ